jgi:DNA-binding NtrC family response regulator
VEEHRILVVDDKFSMRELLATALSERGFEVDTADCGEAAIEELATGQFDIVITDLSMPGKNGMDVLKAVKAQSPDTEVILITAFGTIDTAVEAMRLGAYDFLTKPFKLSEMERKVDKIIQKLQANASRQAQTWIHPSVQHFIGASIQTRQLMKMIARIAPSNISVLITGESGVGKELVARALHEASPRRNAPFVALNCAALAPGILESELFGHEKGAFTGAGEQRTGRFERAHTGTLFLDEVGEIDPMMQVKLLRVLQEGEIERLGGTETLPVDVRIVAATNRDLKAAIEEGNFREDFYYRLNVVSLHVPTLAERRDDIPLLIDHFMSKFSLELGKEVLEVEDSAMDALMNYPWPGNVRELENLLERAVLLADGGEVRLSDLPPELCAAAQAPPIAAAPLESDREGGPTQAQSLIHKTDDLERQLIQEALDAFRWNKTKAAEHLGIKRTTLQYKIKKYNIE